MQWWTADTAFSCVACGNYEAVHILLSTHPVLLTGLETKSPRGGIMHVMLFFKASFPMFHHLLEHDSDLKDLFEDRDFKGCTAIHIAKYHTNIKLTTLMQLGFRFDCADYYFGRTFLILLCRNAESRINYPCWKTVFDLCNPRSTHH